MTTFSTNLQQLLDRAGKLTLQSLLDNFAEKSFAILFLFLLAVPALPLPTGGATHIFELIAMLLATELIAGKRVVWLPKKWLHASLPASLQTTGLPKFIKLIRWIEKYSKPRLRGIHDNRVYIRLYGVLTLLFSLAAFLAPPFSGLDTVPAMGVVLLSLGSIIDDGILSIIGALVGLVGTGLVIFLGSLVSQLL